MDFLVRMELQRRREVAAGATGVHPGHQPREDGEPRIVIDPRQSPQLGPVGLQDPPDHVHLPQLHRRAPLPPLELAIPAPGVRVDQSLPSQESVDPRPRWQRVNPLPGQARAAAAEAPTWDGPPQFQHHRLHRSRHLLRALPRPMRSIRQRRQPTPFIPGQPRLHSLTRHVEPPRHLHHELTVVDHERHCLIPLRHDTQIHQQRRSVKLHLHFTDIESLMVRTFQAGSVCFSKGLGDGSGCARPAGA